MKRLLLGLLLGILLVTPVQSENLTAWQFACRALDIDCRGIYPPDVSYTMALGDRVWGRYVPGESVIFLHPMAPPETLVHELAHYLIHRKLPGIDRCTDEEIARVVTFLWLEEPYSDYWRNEYECPKIDFIEKP